MKSEFPKKIRLGDSVDKQNCSKPAHYVKTRGLQKRRNETGWHSKVVLLNAELHLGPESSPMLLWNRFFNDSIVTMLWSLCSALQTLNNCPHQPDVQTSHPKCVFHSFQIYYYFLGLSSSLHRFIPGVFYSTKLPMPCPAAPYLRLPVFICM